MPAVLWHGRTQLSAEEAFRLLQSKHDRDHQSVWSRFESELTRRTAELRDRFKDELRLALSEKESLTRRVEDSLREVAQLRVSGERRSYEIETECESVRPVFDVRLGREKSKLSL